MPESAERAVQDARPDCHGGTTSSREKPHDDNILVCDSCGSRQIEIQACVDANSSEYLSDLENGMSGQHCADCETSVNICALIYAKNRVVLTSVSTTAGNYKVKWYSAKTRTDIVATNTSGHYPIQVPRQPKSEWINWRKPVSAASSQVTMEAASSISATLPKPKHYSKMNDRRLSLLIRCGSQSRCRRHKREVGCP